MKNTSKEEIMADPIKHVLVLILENRSFDHMLGDLKIGGLDGIDSNKPNTNIFEGKEYPQQEGAGRFVFPDPKHEYEHVVKQLKDNNGGFVRDFAEAYPHDQETWREVMLYHKEATLTALHTLAREFLVCDHWYASVPGPTWPNRLYALSGTSLGRITMPEGLFNWNLNWYDQATIFDRLNEGRVKWKVYYTDFALSFLLVHQWEPQNVANYHKMPQFYRDAAALDPDDFPEFALIEPAYMPPGANDDHPPHDVQATETLIANVYNAIRANSKLWPDTLLVILFDEHGGFYDHAPQIDLEPPDSHQSDGFDFKKSGVRVPAILVSPRVPRSVLSTLFDHTSLLKYLVDKWHLGRLGNRTAAANTFVNSITDAVRADADTPGSIDVRVEPAKPPILEKLTSAQSALVALSHALESMAGGDPATIAVRSQFILSSAQAHLDIAMDRLESFIESRVSKLR
jgi:phospholipase C